MGTIDLLSAANDGVSKATAALGEIANARCVQTGMLMQDLIDAKDRLTQMSAAVEAIASASAALSAELHTAGAVPFQRGEADDACECLRQDHARIRQLLDTAIHDLVLGTRGVAPIAVRWG